MGDGLASSNVNRSYSLAATCIAIFTFTLIFLYPRFASGEVNGMLRCPCGSQMAGTNSRERRYYCLARCGRPQVRADHLEPGIMDRIRATVERPLRVTKRMVDDTVAPFEGILERAPLKTRVATVRDPLRARRRRQPGAEGRCRLEHEDRSGC